MCVPTECNSPNMRTPGMYEEHKGASEAGSVGAGQAGGCAVRGNKAGEAVYADRKSP